MVSRCKIAAVKTLQRLLLRITDSVPFLATEQELHLQHVRYWSIVHDDLMPAYGLILYMLGEWGIVLSENVSLTGYWFFIASGSNGTIDTNADHKHL